MRSACVSDNGRLGSQNPAGARAPGTHSTAQHEGHGLVARFRTWVGIALAGALSVSLAGCSSTGGKRAEDARKAASAEGKAAVDTPRWTFAMITHSGDGDTFWDIVQSS